MPLTVGERLGPYEIQALIGAGGMGEVWKARDTRLGRTVAIKVSQEKFSERFEREARAVAALNHPNICTLHDVGPNYLVMEYVEGAPLKGPLPIDQALKYAAQICDALDAAHRKGVTHRDLKPQNILVTKAGVKLVDFGLARFANAEQALTLSGEVMGTPAYMSPEQWDGKPCDARSDIYALGCVLYEMVTGKRAAQERVPVASPVFESVLRTCLERDPEDRWQTAREVKRELLRPAEVAPARNPWRERAGWIAAAVAVLAGVALFVVMAGERAPVRELIRFQVYPPEKAVLPGPTNATVGVPQFALSPDGHNLAFVSAVPGTPAMIWVRKLDELEAQPLTGTEGGEYPFWSVDSAQVGFFAHGEIRKIRAIGGPVQVAARDVLDPRGGSWSSDGSILFGTGSSGIFRVPESGGPAVLVSKLDAAGKEGAHRWPWFLPDGRHFLFSVRSGDAAVRGVYAGSVNGDRKLLIHSDSPAMYASGNLLYADGSTLMAQAFDPDRLGPSGQGASLAESIGRASNGFAAFSISSTGVLAHSGANSDAARITQFDRMGNPQGKLGQVGDYVDVRLSPTNEAILAASLVDPKTGNPDIWLVDRARPDSPSRLTFGPALNSGPLFSKDGNYIVFRTTRKGGIVEFYKRSAGGGGEEEGVLYLETQLAAGSKTINLVLGDWSHDGGDLLYSVLVSTGYELWRLPFDTRKPVRVTDEKVGMHANLSPDGRFLSYTSDESGQAEVYAQTFPLSNQKWKVSTSGGYEPRWKADSREIYFLSSERKLMYAAVGSGLKPFGEPKELFQTRIADGVTGYRNHYVPTQDGQSFLVITRIGDPPRPAIEVELNWPAGLKR